MKIRNKIEIQETEGRGKTWRTRRGVGRKRRMKQRRRRRREEDVNEETRVQGEKRSGRQMRK